VLRNAPFHRDLYTPPFSMGKGKSPFSNGFGPPFFWGGPFLCALTNLGHGCVKCTAVRPHTDRQTDLVMEIWKWKMQIPWKRVAQKSLIENDLFEVRKYANYHLMDDF
jgi:hypothetical protein